MMAALELLLARGCKYSVEEGKQFVNTQPLKGAEADIGIHLDVGIRAPSLGMLSSLPTG